MRRSSVLTIIAISCVLFAAAALRLHSKSNFAFAAQAQTQNFEVKTVAAQPAAVHPVKETVPASVKPADIPALQPTAAPGTEIYTAKRGEAIPTIARRYLGRTSYLTSADLSDAIRQ